MKKTTNKRKTTTVSCDERTREFIAAEAKRTERSQREVLADMVDFYKKSQKRSAADTQNTKSINEILSSINAKLDIAVKRDDVVVSFLKEHESKLSSPTLDKVRSCENLLNSLVKILQNLQ